MCRRCCIKTQHCPYFKSRYYCVLRSEPSKCASSYGTCSFTSHAGLCSYVNAIQRATSSTFDTRIITNFLFFCRTIQRVHTELLQSAPLREIVVLNVRADPSNHRCQKGKHPSPKPKYVHLPPLVIVADKNNRKSVHENVERQTARCSFHQRKIGRRVRAVS